MPSAQGHITIRRKAKDGESAVRLDLDNEHEDFIYDDEGVRLSGHVTSQARLYDGSVEVTHGVTWSIDLDGTHGTAIGNEGIAVTDSSADMALEEIFYSRNCCWIKTDGTLHVNGISSDMASIKVKAMYKGNAYYADFVAKRRKRDKYELVVTPHSLPYNTSRAWAGKTVGISVNRTSFDGTRREGISLGNLDIDNALFVVAKYRTSGQQNASWHEVDIDGTGRRCTLSVTSGMVSNNEEILIELRKADINEYDEEDASTYTVEDYETIPILKAKDGERGLEGCILRVSEWAKDVEYRNDEALTSGTRYLDIAVVTKGPNTFEAYKCKQTHTSSDSILVSNMTYWEKFNQLQPVYTPLIMAQNALLLFAQTNQLLVMKSDGTTVAAGLGGGKGAGDECNYPLWVGGTTPDTAPFKVRIDGKMFATSGEFSGNIRTVIKDRKESDAEKLSVYVEEVFKLKSDLNLGTKGEFIVLPRSKEYIGSRVLLWNSAVAPYTRSEWDGLFSTVFCENMNDRIYGFPANMTDDETVFCDWQDPNFIRWIGGTIELLGVPGRSMEEEDYGEEICFWCILTLNAVSYKKGCWGQISDANVKPLVDIEYDGGMIGDFEDTANEEITDPSLRIGTFETID